MVRMTICYELTEPNVQTRTGRTSHFSFDVLMRLLFPNMMTIFPEKDNVKSISRILKHIRM